MCHRRQHIQKRRQQGLGSAALQSVCQRTGVGLARRRSTSLVFAECRVTHRPAMPGASATCADANSLVSRCSVAAVGASEVTTEGWSLPPNPASLAGLVAWSVLVLVDRCHGVLVASDDRRRRWRILRAHRRRIVNVCIVTVRRDGQRVVEIDELERNNVAVRHRSTSKSDRRCTALCRSGLRPLLAKSANSISSELLRRREQFREIRK